MRIQSEFRGLMRIQLYTSICIAQATHMHDLSASHDFQNLTPLSLSEVGVPATSELFPATSELRAPPIMAREETHLCHVTQPRARINVSCSRAGQKGATGGPGDHKKGAANAAKDFRRVGTEPGTGQGGTGRDRDGIALISHMESLP